MIAELVCQKSLDEVGITRGLNSPGVLPSQSGVFLIASLTNDGAPTIAENWSLTIAPAGTDKKIQGMLLVTSPRAIVNFPGSNEI